MALALLAAGCGHGDCETETCGDFCAGYGEAPDPELAFESCVANAGTTGGDLILVDEDGEEVYSCRDEHDELGNEVGTCSYDFAGAKIEYCGCSPTGTYR